MKHNNVHYCHPRLGVILLLCLALAGCGFHLRGSLEFSEDLAVIHIRAPNSESDLLRGLRRGLRNSNARISSDADAASAVLHIHEDAAGERVLSVTATGGPEEFELYHTVRYSLMADTETLIDTQEITLTRDYNYDKNDVLGKQRESDVLRAALAEDLAGVILERLSLID